MEAPVNYGIKETKELLALVISSANVAQAAYADKHIGVEDLALLLTLVPKIEPAFTDINLIPKEFSNLSVAEAAELIAFVTTELAVADVKAKDVIEKSLKVAFAAYELLVALRA